MLKFFRIPFATGGDKTAVPDPADVNGFVSYTEGYGFDYQRPKTDVAAKNIERDKMNEIFYDITTAIAEIQAQGVPDFITTALNGGSPYSYALNAIVKYSGDLYISLAAANTADPTDATKWALIPTPARIQSVAYSHAVAGGTADALTATFSPAITALPAAPGTLSVLVRAASANATTTPTFAADGTAAKTIVKGSNSALVAGDIAGAGHWLALEYDATLDKWVLQNPAHGVATVNTTQVQSLSAAVAANALTVGLAATTLDFRNATLTDGAPVAGVAVGALTITVPSGATLGTVNTVAARLVLLVAYNGGSPVLCIANLAGGVNLDETTLISPTTISGAANSASVIYSASAVGANSPFRVVGFVDITEATAGTWATAPTRVQGTGGQALAALSSFGFGQTWQDVTGSRSSGTTFYNTTGRPIAVSAGFTNTVNYTAVVGGVTVAPSTSGTFFTTFIVPAGTSYSITSTSGTVATWRELR